MSHSIAIEVLGIGTVIFSVQAWNTLVVAYALPVFVLRLLTFRGFCRITINIITAGHVVELRMILVGVVFCGKRDKGDAVLIASLFTCAHIHFESIESCTFQTMAGTSLVVVVDDIDLSATRTAIAGALSIIHHAGAGFIYRREWINLSKWWKVIVTQLVQLRIAKVKERLPYSCDST